jgi:DNA topoisomerase-1
MAKPLVIVESPAKAKTITRFLGSGYLVESSIGHVRDLPSKASEIPPKYKNEDWARTGVNVEDQFKPLYIIPAKKKQQVAKLRQLTKKASELFLATDEDREGEAIAWHLTEVLKPKVPVKRMVFDEITAAAIRRAVHHTRDLDMHLVDAQETRRVLDRLFGYEVSPVLWRKVGPKLSAGRVQSVATRLVVNRERDRMAFKRAEYWDIDAKLATRAGQARPVAAKLVELGGKRVASGKDFDPATGQLASKSDARWLDEQTARSAAASLESAAFAVSEVNQTPFSQRAHPPFITSTLQQEAARKLGFTPRRTMRVAQSLYENGYITYMRTDSTHLSTQAVSAARKQAAELYGKQYLPRSPRVFKTKSKNAQEAHEAIRPAGESFRTPRAVKGELDADACRVYELIWKRTVACQMKDATGMRTNVRITAQAGSHGQAVFAASGKVITFAGFLRAYVEGADDPEAELEDQERVLPPIKSGEQLDAKAVEPKGHATQPPARFTEASLIRELEERGIGRPSTYASIIQTIEERGYVWKKGTALVPTFTAFAVIQLLERHLSDLVDYQFTARMEDALDAIAAGECDAVPWLRHFYFGEPSAKTNGGHIVDMGLKRLVGDNAENIDPRQVATVPLGADRKGNAVVVRVGRYGPYVQIGEGDARASVPEDLPPDELTVDRAIELVGNANQKGRILGHDPETSKPIYLKNGRFGPYVQLGDPEPGGKGKAAKRGKPKMASLWPSMTVDTITIQDALMLLSFPRTVGVHPETDQPIIVQDGRYGPYLKMGSETRSLAGHEQLRTITLDQAVSLLAQPKKRGRSAAPATLADLGIHPETGAPLQVKSGRYGPYVTDGVVNATIPKGKDPASITLEEAVGLIAAREQRLRDQGKDPRAPKASRAKKKTVKRTTKKKTAAKKTSGKRVGAAKTAAAS